jgi:ribosomal protein L29
MNKLIKFSYHKTCRGKPEKRINPETHKPEYWQDGHKINLGYGWRNSALPLDEVFMLVSQDGMAIAPELENDNRCDANFVSHQIALVDIDSGMTIEEIEVHPFYLAYGVGYYTTPSHTEEAHRFRVMYCLPEPVTDADNMRMIYQGLLVLHGAADPSCKDAARFFFGTVEASSCHYQGRLLDQEGLDYIIAAWSIIEKPAPRLREVNNTYSELAPKSPEQVIELLMELKKYYFDLSYNVRRDVTWAVGSTLSPQETITIMRSLWPDDNKTGKYEMFVNDRKRGDITLGTVYHLIRQHNSMFGKKPKNMSIEELETEIKRIKK